jgi:hypothetical protein
MSEVREISEVQADRIRVIRRLGDRWFYLVFIFAVFHYRHAHYNYDINANTEGCEDISKINKRLQLFMSFLYFGCWFYIFYLLVSFAPLVTRRIKDIYIRVFELAILLGYFGFLFFYANILYLFSLSGTAYCNSQTIDISSTNMINIYYKCVLVFFLYGWYMFLAVKALQRVFLYIKGAIWGQDHSLESESILYDMTN